MEWPEVDVVERSFAEVGDAPVRGSAKEVQRAVLVVVLEGVEESKCIATIAVVRLHLPDELARLRMHGPDLPLQRCRRGRSLPDDGEVRVFRDLGIERRSALRDGKVVREVVERRPVEQTVADECRPLDRRRCVEHLEHPGAAPGVLGLLQDGSTRPISRGRASCCSNSARCICAGRSFAGTPSPRPAQHSASSSRARVLRPTYRSGVPTGRRQGPRPDPSPAKGLRRTPHRPPPARRPRNACTPAARDGVCGHFDEAERLDDTLQRSPSLPLGLSRPASRVYRDTYAS